jgi:hypothetical protein
MIKTTFAIVALLAIGVTFAYAEESTVQVPFDYHGMSCWLESELIYQCIWEGELTPFTVEDLEQFKDMISPEVYAEKLAELQPTETVVIAIPEKDPTEKKIELLADKLYSGTADVEDSVLYHLLTQLDTCQQGMDSRTAPFQNAREFTISEYTQWNVNHIEYKQEIGKLVKAIEECEAQQVLAYQVVGAGYMNMPTGEDDVQYSLLTELEGIQALDFELYTKNSNRIDMNGICDNNQYDWKNRIMMGCEDTRDYGDRSKVYNPKGYITYYSDANSKYMKYLQDNSRYATVEDWNNAEKLAEPLVQEMLEQNSWYGRD